MVGSWYVLVMCEKEPLLWTPPLPSNGRLPMSAYRLVHMSDCSKRSLVAWIVRSTGMLVTREITSKETMMSSSRIIMSFNLFHKLKAVKTVFNCSFCFSNQCVNGSYQVTKESICWRVYEGGNRSQRGMLFMYFW